MITREESKLFSPGLLFYFTGITIILLSTVVYTFHYHNSKIIAFIGLSVGFILGIIGIFIYRKHLIKKAL